MLEVILLLEPVCSFAKELLLFAWESLLLFIPYPKREQKKSSFLTATISSTASCHLPQDKHWRVLTKPEFCPPHKNTSGCKERMKQWCSLPQLPQPSHTESHSLYLRDKNGLCPYPSTHLLVMSEQMLHLPHQKEKKEANLSPAETRSLGYLLRSLFSHQPYLLKYIMLNSLPT